jgi:hypothetical protein
VLERWTWRRCAELTVEQYREVLAMPGNIEKLRRNGRLATLTVGARHQPSGSVSPVRPVNRC